MSVGKFVNLDDERKSVTIQVEGKTFEIYRVVNKVREMYGAYLAETSKFLKDVQSMRDAANVNDIAELEKISEKLDAAQNQYNASRAKTMVDMLALILEKNGYSFDEDWWTDNTDFYSIERFVVEAINKDLEPSHGGGKKGDA